MGLAHQHCQRLCYIFIFTKTPSTPTWRSKDFLLQWAFTAGMNGCTAGAKQDTLAITRISRGHAVLSLITGVVFSALFAYLLSTRTDAQQPVIDSTLTVFSLIAQYLLARKILEN